MAAAPERTAPDAALRLSHGFAQAMAGDAAGAGQNFAGIGRLIGAAAAPIAWPSRDDLAWPAATTDLAAAFEALKPPGAAWPRITLVTPSFNQAAFLEDCLTSVAAQAYPNIQHIVMDGGSSDGSDKIAAAHAGAIAVYRREKDRGQSHALNKGFALADGELIGWLNSDDMLAPGALFAIALGYLTSGADIVHGHVLAHRDRIFEAANAPRAAEDFSPEALGDIFGRWFQGHFFYQPEAFFTRRLLEAAGGRLDEALRYTMDYELWLRFAKAGARVAAVDWPVALFRHHDDQKTASLDDCIVEQADVRDRFVDFSPPRQRRMALASHLAAFWSAPLPRIVFVAREDAVVADLAARLAPASRGEGVALEALGAAAISSPELGNPSGDPLFVVILRSAADADMLDTLRARQPGALVAAWFWNAGRETGASYLAAEKADLVIPGRDPGGYLRNRHAFHLAAVPANADRIGGVITALRRAALDARHV